MKRLIVPRGFKDAIVSRIEIKLTFWAALQALFGKPIVIHESHYCREPPGDVRTSVVCRDSLDSPCWIKSFEREHGFEHVSDDRDFDEVYASLGIIGPKEGHLFFD